MRVRPDPEPDTKHATQSEQNAQMLQHVTDQVASLAKGFDAFIKRQDEENKLIHERITEQDEKYNKSIETIKDVLASKGKVTGQFIFSLIAVLLSFTALTGGILHSYIGGRLENIRPLIQANTESISALDRIETRHEEALRRIEVDMARADGYSDADRKALWQELSEQRGTAGK